MDESQTLDFLLISSGLGSIRNNGAAWRSLLCQIPLSTFMNLYKITHSSGGNFSKPEIWLFCPPLFFIT